MKIGELISDAKYSNLEIKPYNNNGVLFITVFDETTNSFVKKPLLEWDNIVCKYKLNSIFQPEQTSDGTVSAGAQGSVFSNITIHAEDSSGNRIQDDSGNNWELYSTSTLIDLTDDILYLLEVTPPVYKLVFTSDNARDETTGKTGINIDFDYLWEPERFDLTTDIILQASMLTSIYTTITTNIMKSSNTGSISINDAKRQAQQIILNNLGVDINKSVLNRDNTGVDEIFSEITISQQTTGEIGTDTKSNEQNTNESFTIYTKMLEAFVSDSETSASKVVQQLLAETLEETESESDQSGSEQTANSSSFFQNDTVKEKIQRKTAESESFIEDVSPNVISNIESVRKNFEIVPANYSGTSYVETVNASVTIDELQDSSGAITVEILDEATVAAEKKRETPSMTPTMTQTQTTSVTPTITSTYTMTVPTPTITQTTSVTPTITSTYTMTAPTPTMTSTDTITVPTPTMTSTQTTSITPTITSTYTITAPTMTPTMTSTNTITVPTMTPTTTSTNTITAATMTPTKINETPTLTIPTPTSTITAPTPTSTITAPTLTPTFSVTVTSPTPIPDSIEINSEEKHGGNHFQEVVVATIYAYLNHLNRKTPLTYTVTVSNNRFLINDNPYLTLYRGNTYIFDISAVNTHHSFRFSETDDGIHNNGVEYTIGVVNDNDTISLTINSETPSLYYYCDESFHTDMGNQINIVDDPTEISFATGNYTDIVHILYFENNSHDISRSYNFEIGPDSPDPPGNDYSLVSTHPDKNIYIAGSWYPSMSVDADLPNKFSYTYMQFLGSGYFQGVVNNAVSFDNFKFVLHRKYTDDTLNDDIFELEADSDASNILNKVMLDGSGSRGPGLYVGNAAYGSNLAYDYGGPNDATSEDFYLKLKIVNREYRYIIISSRQSGWHMESRRISAYYRNMNIISSNNETIDNIDYIYNFDENNYERYSGFFATINIQGSSIITIGDVLIAYVNIGDNEEIRGISKNIIQNWTFTDGITANIVNMNIYYNNSESTEIINFKLYKQTTTGVIEGHKIHNLSEHINIVDLTTYRYGNGPSSSFTFNIGRFTKKLYGRYDEFSFNINLSDQSKETIFGSNISNISSYRNQYYAAIKVGSTWLSSTLNDRTNFSDNPLSILTFYSVELQSGIEHITLQFDGIPLSISTSIQLYTGYNWIGYLPSSEQNIRDVLNTTTISNGNPLSGIFTRYRGSLYTGTTFVGNLTTMKPGSGYIIQMDSPAVLTYNVEPNSQAVSQPYGIYKITIMNNPLPSIIGDGYIHIETNCLSFAFTHASNSDDVFGIYKQEIAGTYDVLGEFIIQFQDITTIGSPNLTVSSGVVQGDISQLTLRVGFIIDENNSVNNVQGIFDINVSSNLSDMYYTLSNYPSSFTQSPFDFQSQKTTTTLPTSISEYFTMTSDRTDFGVFEVDGSIISNFVVTMSKDNQQSDWSKKADGDSLVLDVFDKNAINDFNPDHFIIYSDQDTIDKSSSTFVDIDYKYPIDISKLNTNVKMIASAISTLLLKLQDTLGNSYDSENDSKILIQDKFGINLDDIFKPEGDERPSQTSEDIKKCQDKLITITNLLKSSLNSSTDTIYQSIANSVISEPETTSTTTETVGEIFISQIVSNVIEDVYKSESGISELDESQQTIVNNITTNISSISSTISQNNTNESITVITQSVIENIQNNNIDVNNTVISNDELISIQNFISQEITPTPTLTIPTPTTTKTEPTPTLTVPTPTVPTPTVPTPTIPTPTILTPTISTTITEPTPTMSNTVTVPTPTFSLTVTEPTPTISTTITEPTPTIPTPTIPTPTPTISDTLTATLTEPTPTIPTPTIPTPTSTLTFTMTITEPTPTITDTFSITKTEPTPTMSSTITEPTPTIPTPTIPTPTIPTPTIPTPTMSSTITEPTPTIPTPTIPTPTIPTPTMSSTITEPTPTIPTPTIPTPTIPTPTISSTITEPTPTISSTITEPTPTISSTITEPTPTISSTITEPTPTIPTPTITKTQPTPTPTDTISITATYTLTETDTISKTITSTSTLTDTTSNSITLTPTHTITQPTPTPTNTITNTSTSTLTDTLTMTDTLTSSMSSTPSYSPTFTIIPTAYVRFRQSGNNIIISIKSNVNISTYTFTFNITNLSTYNQMLQVTPTEYAFNLFNFVNTANTQGYDGYSSGPGEINPMITGYSKREFGIDYTLTSSHTFVDVLILENVQDLSNFGFVEVLLDQPDAAGFNFNDIPINIIYIQGLNWTP